MMQMMEYDRLYKIIIVGDSETGKTQVLSRFCNDQFSQEFHATVVMEHTRKTLEQSNICAHLWDLAGNDVFRSVTKSYYKNAVGAVVVYDITKVRSFENAGSWIDDIRQTLGPDSPTILLLGNKLDLRHHRSVSTEEGHQLAKEKKAFFLEVSAKDAINIQKAFSILTNHITSIDEVQPKHDVNLGAGLEQGAKALSEMTKNSHKTAEVVVQAQPKSKSFFDSTKQRLEGAKSTCCYKAMCCKW